MIIGIQTFEFEGFGRFIGIQTFETNICEGWKTWQSLIQRISSEKGAQTFISSSSASAGE